MLYYINQRTLPELSSPIFLTAYSSIPVEGYPLDVFNAYVEQHNINLNQDKEFSRLNTLIDNASIPMPYVLQDMRTFETHPFSDATISVYACWLLSHTSAPVWRESQWFDPRCYQEIINISQHTDVYIYDNTDMYLDREWRMLKHGLCVEYFTKHTLPACSLHKYLSDII